MANTPKMIGTEMMAVKGLSNVYYLDTGKLPGKVGNQILKASHKLNFSFC
jgi:hypothetical protein